MMCFLLWLRYIQQEKREVWKGRHKSITLSLFPRQLQYILVKRSLVHDTHVNILYVARSINCTDPLGNRVEWENIIISLSQQDCQLVESSTMYQRISPLTFLAESFSCIHPVTTLQQKTMPTSSYMGNTDIWNHLRKPAWGQLLFNSALDLLSIYVRSTH